jgi:hypothetical protein
MQLGFLGPLGDRTVGKEPQGADDLITPLDMIRKVQVQLGKIAHWFHGRFLPIRAPWPCREPRASSTAAEAIRARGTLPAWAHCRS